MSNGINRNDDIQDYFDLLKNDTSSESKNTAQKKENEKISSKKINAEAFNDVVDEDFFDNFDIKEESTGDIGRFFEDSKKIAPKKPSPPPMPNKKPAPPPMVKREKFIKAAAPATEKSEEKKIIPEVKTEQMAQKIGAAEVKRQPVAEKASAVEIKEPTVEQKLPQDEVKMPKTEVKLSSLEEKTAAEKENSLLEAIKNKETEKKPTSFSDDYFKLFESSSSEKISNTEIKKEEFQKSETEEKVKFNAEIVSDGDKDMIKREEENKKEKNPFKRLALWFKALPKKKKIIVSVIAAFLALIIILTSAVGIFVMQKFSLMGDNTGIQADDDDIVYNEEEDIGNIEIDIGSSDFKQSLIDWATTGNDKHMQSKNVINVLLIGADSRKGRNEGNTDVMMLVSVNRKTKTLKMISFLRDSYLYIEGNKNSYCTKLNAAFSMGGPECLINTIENNYKIEIDNYVMVNFESFKEIIDAMGGITVDVQEYEADYISSFFKIKMPSGNGVKLNGKQALGFCRVRGCDTDGDVSRTRRQRQVIDSMVNRVMNSSISEINKYIDVLLPYVDTGYSEAQIISLGLKAITNGWAKYDRNQLSMPSPECRTPGSANMWIWVVDYQKAAYELQMELYGESNIVLDEGRITIMDVYKGASYSGSSNSIKDNNKNDEEVPDTTEKVTKAPVTTEKNNNEEKTTVEETMNNEPSTEVITTQPIETIPDEPQTEEETEDIPDEPVNGEDEPQTEEAQNE